MSGSLAFIKLTPDAVAPEEINGEVTILSAEDGNVSYMQHYAFHTGIGIAVPEGKVAMLAETQPMGSRGISIVGKFVTRQDMGEVRVSMHNLSRTAFPVQKGMPIARLILLDADGLSLEEVEGDDKKSALDHWQEEIDKRKQDKRAADLHGGSVLNGPGKNPVVKPIKDDSNKTSVQAAKEQSAPDGNEVAKANAAKNQGQPDTPIPGSAQNNPNAVRPPTQTGTPATV